MKMLCGKVYGLLASLWIGWMVFANASAGDGDIKFIKCFEYCYKDQCRENRGIGIDSKKEAIEFPRYPWWTCEDYCKFYCIDKVSSQRVLKGQKSLKYFGHWAFQRVLGLEESMSSLFSALNAVPHFYYGFINVQWQKKGSDRLSLLLAIYPIFGLLAWIGSTFYHAYKTSMSSLVDYSFALMFLSLGLLLALVKLVGPVSQLSLQILFVSLTGMQLFRMIGGYVSYDEHMLICISISIMSVLIWAYWSVFQSTVRQLSYYCLLCQIWFLLASLLEILDFPPLWGHFDAHSLWHLATIPLGFFWYKFWKMEREHLKKEA